MIFDFDGTLADSKECSVLATKSAFQEMKLNRPSEKIIEYFMGIPIEKSFVEMSDRYLTTTELETLLTIFRKYYKEYEENSLKVFEGIPKMLQEISEKKTSCFVLSSKKTDVLDRNLRTLGINHFFKETIGSDKVSHYKPHPEGIDFIINNYNFSPQQTLMIGDAIFDIQMGHAANVYTGAVTWGSHNKEKLESEKPTILFSKPSDIIDYVL